MRSKRDRGALTDQPIDGQPRRKKKGYYCALVRNSRLGVFEAGVGCVNEVTDSISSRFTDLPWWKTNVPAQRIYDHKDHPVERCSRRRSILRVAVGSEPWQQWFVGEEPSSEHVDGDTNQ